MYNPKSPAVKRLMKEAKELADPTEEYYATPLEDNIFEWHFTVRGPPSTEFEGGYYHGRIILPSQYPMQPPNIILLTPNGRFEINKKICLSISEHHPETWQPSWSIRTALLALIAFMPTPSAGTIGALDYTPEERKVLARKSLNWHCELCSTTPASVLLAAPPTSHTTGTKLLTQEESLMIKQIALKADENTDRKLGDRVEDIIDVERPSDAVLETASRRRLHIEVSRDSVVSEISSQDSLLQASIQSTYRDQLWTGVIWVCVIIIGVLVIRRLFFL